MYGNKSLLLALLFCALAATAASAQTTVPTTPEPEPPMVGGRSTPGERVAPAGAAPTLPWSVTLGLQETYEGGGELSGGGSAGAWGSRVQGGIGRTFTLKRGSIDVHGDATQAFYHGTSQPAQLMYGVALAGGYSLTRRLTWRASQGISSTLARESEVLTEAGRVLDSGATTRTIMTSTDLAYQASEKLTMRVEAAQTLIAFQESDLTSGNSLNVRFNLSRQVGRSQTVGVSFGHTFTSGATGDIQGVLGTWSTRWGRYVSISATGGIRPYTLAGVPGYQFAPGGTAAVSVAGENQSLSFSYERAIEQAYGIVESLGAGLTHSADRVNAEYGVALGRRIAVNVSGNYGMNTYPQIPGYHIGGRTVMVSARYLLARQLSAGAGYSVWWRTESGSPTTTDPAASSISTSRAMFSLSYAFGWR